MSLISLSSVTVGVANSLRWCHFFSISSDWSTTHPVPAYDTPFAPVSLLSALYLLAPTCVACYVILALSEFFSLFSLPIQSPPGLHLHLWFLFGHEVCVPLAHILAHILQVSSSDDGPANNPQASTPRLWVPNATIVDWFLISTS